ncbi:exonuclease SbcD [Actinoplanes campanulatus]|uniref:Nuclease SbcCD subunit D n=1 Tax=Actinoplanes campanulatus TaxID=113559 RepID=A0A7W5ABD1_9ACTN|nr:exonuclease SbcCD subunit D [Actinoplanes campanulatus]MBB3092910.1 exonuclease SbcD [Actinoplanes campanulatus]GGM99859.1 nuclease SbcCD subunit D [Actinoplanes campanulatus]GID33994.1 nuclease SbcCD subunit D [Actinoplanes campanulatus]
MRILHTSDWHVGKVLKGRDRRDEHRRVLAQVIEIAQAEKPDLVIVAGDLYDTAAPTADSTKLVTRALSALRRTGARVVAIGGNHDNGAALDALRPWADAAGIELRGSYASDLNDLLIEGVTEGGERWRLVAMPFLSQRYAIRAAEMYELTAAEANQTYADLVARLIAKLSEPFAEPGVVNLLTAHLTIVGASTGGGEREAHTVMGYAVPATVFPPNAHYVALGHLHRTQSVISPCPTRYSGSPLAVDFGEEENVCSVAIVDVSCDKAAHVRDVPVTSALTLRTVRGTLEQLATVNLPDAWLRVLVREAPRPGLREDVQELLPNALEVRIDPDMLPSRSGARSAERAGRSPRELFGDYLDSRGNAEEGVRELFDQLYDEVSSNQ